VSSCSRCVKAKPILGSEGGRATEEETLFGCPKTGFDFTKRVEINFDLMCATISNFETLD